MGRRSPAPTTLGEAVPYSATILPGVAMPGWAMPAGAQPEPEPLPDPRPNAHSGPASESVGAVAGHVESIPVLVAATSGFESISPPMPPQPLSALTAPTGYGQTFPSPEATDTDSAVPVVPDAVPATWVTEAEADSAYPTSYPTVDLAALPAPTAANDVSPATHRDPGTTKSRSRLMILLAVVAVLALGAIAAFVFPGFLNASEDEATNGPVATASQTVVLPAEFGAYKAKTDAASKATAAKLAAGFAKGGAIGTTATVYGTTAGGSAVVLAARVPAGTVMLAKDFFTGMTKAGAVKGLANVSAGAVGGTVRCGTSIGGATCGWVSSKSVGMTFVKGVSPAAAGVTTAAVRAGIR